MSATSEAHKTATAMFVDPDNVMLATDEDGDGQRYATDRYVIYAVTTVPDLAITFSGLPDGTYSLRASRAPAMVRPSPLAGAKAARLWKELGNGEFRVVTPTGWMRGNSRVPAAEFTTADGTSVLANAYVTETLESLRYRLERADSGKALRISRVSSSHDVTFARREYTTPVGYLMVVKSPAVDRRPCSCKAAAAV